ncbi:MAG: hypothetical protein JNM09_28860 [Blastocatellia bacterium]|nr:hypothetical protein [Blastocatellia bacterium]
MTNKELKQIMFDCTCGTPELRWQKMQEAQLSLQREMERLRHDGAAQCEEYKRHLQAWLCQRINGLVKPRTILSDLRLARLAQGIAYLLTAGELVLACFLGLTLHTNPGFLLLLAIVAVVAPKSLLLIWHNEAQPQLTKKRLRNWVLVPSLVTVIVAINLLFLARSVLGALALLLLPFFSGAFYLLALGAVGLSSGLFAMAFLLFWSKHAEKKFKATEQEAMNTERVYRQVQEIEKELRGAESPSAMPTPAPATLPAAEHEFGLITPLPKKTPAVVSRSLFSLLLIGALWGGGCATHEPSTVLAKTTATPTAAVTPIATVPSATLEVYVDWSLSTATQPLRQAAQALLTALPTMVEQQHIERLVFYQFGAHGWDAVEVTRLEFPRRQASAENEMGHLFGPVQEAQSAQAQTQYHDQLQATLQSLQASSFLPPADFFPEPPCTDLVGLLHRLAAAPPTTRRINILITDGHETCQQKLPSVATLTAPTIVILLPEEERSETPTPSDVQFNLRREALAQAVPNAVIVPYFHDLNAAIVTANQKGGSHL